MSRRSAAPAVLLMLTLGGLASSPAQAATCADPGAQGAFTASVAHPKVAPSRQEPIQVRSDQGLTDRSGSWDRPTAASVTVDDPATASVLAGDEDVDAYVVPSGTGTVGVTVAWTQTSNRETDDSGNYLECRIERHLTFSVVAGRRVPATVLGTKTGDYERNTVAGGLSLKGCGDTWLTAKEPVAWTLHWTTSGRAPTRASKTLTWRSADPCSDVRPAPITGPKRVTNRTFYANRYAFTRLGPAVNVGPSFHSRGMRGWWEVRVGGTLVKSTRFKWVYGTGHRTAGGQSFPITGVTLQHDTGPCPDLACSGWARFAGV